MIRARGIDVGASGAPAAIVDATKAAPPSASWFPPEERERREGARFARFPTAVRIFCCDPAAGE